MCLHHTNNQLSHQGIKIIGKFRLYIQKLLYVSIFCIFIFFRYLDMGEVLIYCHSFLDFISRKRYLIGADFRVCFFLATSQQFELLEFFFNSCENELLKLIFAENTVPRTALVIGLLRTAKILIARRIMGRFQRAWLHSLCFLRERFLFLVAK